MAIERFDEQYRDRLNDPNSYVRINSIVEEDTAPYGVALPSKVGYGVLLFGYFVSAERIDCQPWLLGADIQDDDRSQHQQVAIDVKQEHFTHFNLGYEYNPDGRWRPLTPETWTCYAWKGNSLRGSEVVLAVAHQYPYRDANYGTKLDAVVASTEVGNVLEDHEIYIPQGVIRQGSMFSNEEVYAD